MEGKIDKQKIDELLTRGVGEFVDPDGTFRKKLETNPGKIIIKFGIDPTKPDIHLGHAVVLRKLRQFQDLGCRVIFLIGDITAQIGDPTGKSKIRPEVNMQEIRKNMDTYLNQVDKILLKDSKVFAWTVNSDWFVSINDIKAPDGEVITITSSDGKSIKLPALPGTNIIVKAAHWLKTRMQKENINNYTLINLLSILSKITNSRLIERDMFQNRIKNGEPIFMHEMIYPVIQGIDSDAIAGIYGSCDLEVGGTDQHFNMLVGRDVMEINKKIPQSVLSFKILEGLDGKEKMSKSLDNYVGITDESGDMYGKIMSIPDSSIANYFELCTFTPMDEIEKIRKALKSGTVNPKDLKMRLAREIVAIYHGEAKANKAEENFINTFQKREIPEDIEEIKGQGKLINIIVAHGIISSTSAARRLFDAGAVTDLTDNEKITAGSDSEDGHVYKIGKHRFIKII